MILKSTTVLIIIVNKYNNKIKAKRSTEGIRLLNKEIRVDFSFGESNKPSSSSSKNSSSSPPPYDYGDRAYSSGSSSRHDDNRQSYYNNKSDRYYPPAPPPPPPSKHNKPNYPPNLDSSNEYDYYQESNRTFNK